MNSESTITERGQVTVPKKLRDSFGLKPGMSIEFVPSDEGILIKKAKSEHDPFQEGFGVLKGKLRTDEYLLKTRGKSGMKRTAVDSSVLLDYFSADPVFGVRSTQALRQSLQDGCLMACEVVYAEIRPCFETRRQILGLTENIDLQFEPLKLEAALLAGEIWKKYRKQGGKRDKMIPDFLIAAHAQEQADQFLTRDRGFYRTYFPDLKIIEP